MSEGTNSSRFCFKAPSPMLRFSSLAANLPRSTALFSRRLDTCFDDLSVTSSPTAWPPRNQLPVVYSIPSAFNSNLQYIAATD